MEFLLGAAGALLCMVLLGAGAVCGWQARKHTAAVTAEPLTEQQKQRLREEQEAWSALHHYSVDDAYGICPENDPERRG